MCCLIADGLDTSMKGPLINIIVSGNGFFADYYFPFAGLSPSLSRNMFEVVVVVIVAVAVAVAGAGAAAAAAVAVAIAVEVAVAVARLQKPTPSRGPWRVPWPSKDGASFAASFAQLYRIFRARPTMISQKLYLLTLMLRAHQKDLSLKRSPE